MYQMTHIIFDMDASLNKRKFQSDVPAASHWLISRSGIDEVIFKCVCYLRYILLGAIASLVWASYWALTPLEWVALPLWDYS